MMEWWLDKGIDGFRMDVINAISKAEGLPDAPVAVNGTDIKRKHVFWPKLYYNQDGVHEFLQEMNREVLSRYDIMTVGETGEVTPANPAESISKIKLRPYEARVYRLA